MVNYWPFKSSKNFVVPDFLAMAFFRLDCRKNYQLLSFPSWSRKCKDKASKFLQKQMTICTIFERLINFWTFNFLNISWGKRHFRYLKPCLLGMIHVQILNVTSLLTCISVLSFNSVQILVARGIPLTIEWVFNVSHMTQIHSYMFLCISSFRLWLNNILNNPAPSHTTTTAPPTTI